MQCLQMPEYPSPAQPAIEWFSKNPLFQYLVIKPANKIGYERQTT